MSYTDAITIPNLLRQVAETGNADNFSARDVNLAMCRDLIAWDGARWLLTRKGARSAKAA